jgi:thiol-disulfide isomerase/thioredoxin
MNDILTRILIAAALAGVGLLAYRLWRAASLNRARTAVRGLTGWRPGRPTVVYFTAPDCVPCRTVQRPAIERLTDRHQRVTVIEIDASARPDLADRWGVLSVPTTFVLDPAGQPVHANHGVAPQHQLERQLAGFWSL